MKEYNNDSLFVKVPLSYINEYKSDINNSYQIGFVDGGDSNVSYIYAQEQSFGDGAKSDKTLLTESIIIEGGPLADKIKGTFPNDVIPVGTSLQSLLKNLLCVELWSKSISVTHGKITFTNNAPSISGTQLIKVGSYLYNLPNYTFNACSHSKTNSNIGTFTYGYFVGSTENKTGKNITYTPQFTNSNSTATISYNIKHTYNSNTDTISGSKTFTFTSIPTTSNNASNIKLSADANKVRCKYGSTITASISTSLDLSKITYSITGVTNVYDRSNLGGKNTNTKYTLQAITNANVSSVQKTSGSRTFTTQYPIYYTGKKYNGGNPDSVAVSDNKTIFEHTSLLSTNTSTKIYLKYVDTSSSGQPYRIYIPKVYSNTTITMRGYNPTNTGVNGGYNVDLLEFIKSGNTTNWKTLAGDADVYAQFDNTEYDIWECNGGGTNGQEITITLKK